MSNYPRDEFDNVPESSSRQGVHRTAMTAPRRSLLPIFSFAVIALIIGAVAFFAISKLPSNTASAPNSSTTSSSAVESSSSSTSPSATPTATAQSTTPPPPTSTTPPPPPVDRTQPVSVYNATLTTGLGARVSQQVRDAGWTVALTANWQGLAQPSSVIFYNGTAQKANADELGALLGITRLVDTAELGIPLAVVLGPGYQ